MTRHTEAQIADLMNRFAEEVAAPTPAQPSTRRTRIAESATLPDLVPGLYRVTTMDGTEIDAHADDSAGAVLRAMEIARAVKVEHYAAMIFMWQYEVTDADGNKVRGSDPGQRAAMDKARIAEQNKSMARRTQIG